MRIIRISEAQASFPALLSAVEAGEELVLTRHGRIVARMLPGTRGGLPVERHARRDEQNSFSEFRFAIETGLISPLD